MDIQTLLTVLGVPAIYAIIEAIKKAGAPLKYLPIISVIIGAIVGIIIALANNQDVVTGLFIGIALGSVPVASHETIKNLSVKK